MGAGRRGVYYICMYMYIRELYSQRTQASSRMRILDIAYSIHYLYVCICIYANSILRERKRAAAMGAGCRGVACYTSSTSSLVDTSSTSSLVDTSSFSSLVDTSSTSSLVDTYIKALLRRY